jgi:hypothetical protein
MLNTHYPGPKITVVHFVRPVGQCPRALF